MPMINTIAKKMMMTICDNGIDNEHWRSAGQNLWRP